MSKNVIMMSSDIPVFEFNFDEGIYNILNKQLLPYQLQGNLYDVPELKDGMSKYEITQYTRAVNKNYESVIGFLSSRVLSLSRENAKKVYNLFGYNQIQDNISKSKIALLFRAVSLQDNYWVKLEDETIKWADVDLRNNSLNKIVAMVSLHGTSLTLQGDARTPELSGQGAYAKAWIHENDGLYLLKKGSAGKSNTSPDNESRIEVMVSNILDACNVPHVKYTAAESNNTFVCKCKCLTNTHGQARGVV